MRKLVFTFLFLTFSLSYHSFAQTSGYENLLWGSSVDDVRKKYHNIERMIDSDTDFSNSIKYEEKYSSGSVESRKFVFWKNKLVKVLVTYNIDNITADGLVSNFINRFGNPIDNDYSEEDIAGVTAKRYSWFWNDNGTRVILRAASIGFLETVLAIYVSLKYSDEYDDEKSKNIEF